MKMNHPIQSPETNQPNKTNKKLKRKTKMKKLVAIAMIALTGTVAFGACSYTPEETAWVYKWKFTGKTTAPKKISAKIYSSACSAAPETCAVRTPTSLKIEGYTWACAPGCGTTAFPDIAEVNEIFWCKKPAKYSMAGGTFADVCNIIGKKASKVELGGTATFDAPNAKYDITFAGFGAYSKKNSRIKNAKGRFAGFAEPCVCAKSSVWDCSTLAMCCEDNPTSVVFGKWSVTFKKNASKKFLNRGKLPNIPSWAQNLND